MSANTLSPTRATALPDSVREARIRRVLKKEDVLLRKSRARSWSYDNQGDYMLVDIGTRGIVGGSRFDWSLDDVEEWANRT